MEHTGFSLTRQASRVPSMKRREVFGESRETGRPASCQEPLVGRTSESHLWGGFPHLVRTFLHSYGWQLQNELIYFSGVWRHIQGHQRGMLCNCLVDALPYTLGHG